MQHRLHLAFPVLLSDPLCPLSYLISSQLLVLSPNLPFPLIFLSLSPALAGAGLLSLSNLGYFCLLPLPFFFSSQMHLCLLIKLLSPVLPGYQHLRPLKQQKIAPFLLCSRGRSGWSALRACEILAEFSFQMFTANVWTCMSSFSKVFLFFFSAEMTESTFCHDTAVSGPCLHEAVGRAVHFAVFLALKSFFFGYIFHKMSSRSCKPQRKLHPEQSAAGRVTSK